MTFSEAMWTRAITEAKVKLESTQKELERATADRAKVMRQMNRLRGAIKTFTEFKVKGTLWPTDNRADYERYC